MLALAYLVLMVVFGDTISRPFFSSVSRVHRLATAFLVGLAVSTWLSYLLSLAFASVDQPLIAGDALAAWLMGLVIAIRLLPSWSRRRPWARAGFQVSRPERWDWLVIAAIGAFVTWMMVSTYNFGGGHLNIAVDLWSDFGPTTAIAQSFALGHNFPTQYPHFAGPSILYHFLFYFQVGNLTFLGLDPATANNVLSIGALTSMLALVMALGQRLFGSAAVGRIAALLFFFHGALSFVPFLASFATPADALAGIGRLDHYLASGFPYRGEEWGIWTQNTFLNQRHLSSAIGIVLVALLFVVDRLQARMPVVAATAALVEGGAQPEVWGSIPAARFARAASERLTHLDDHIRAGLADPFLPGYIVAGLLLGLLPLFNSPMFIASAALFGVVFLVLPNRVQMMALAVGAAIPAIPQILFLRPAGLPGTTSFPAFHWGYTVDPPTVLNVLVYLGFIFGPKLALAVIGLVPGTSLQRRLFLAAAILVVVPFSIQFSVEVFANHKFLNLWLIIADVYAAYALVWLWGRRGASASALAGAGRLLGRTVAVAMVAVIGVGGVIDLIPISHERSLSYALAGDPLFDWVVKETRPSDVFLTDLYVAHPILLAGRPIYLGWTYYAWSAGYDVDTRQALYREMFQSEDRARVTQLLQQAGIAYVAIDDGLRHGTTVQHLNEDLYRASFTVAYEDTAGTDGHIAIYRVPAGTPAGPGGPSASPAPSGAPRAGPPDNLFVAGQGAASGRFSGPRGIAVAPDGTVLVADTDNNLIERFAADGKLITSFGGLGDGPGQFHTPSGVAVDSRGHIFVADTGNARLVELDDQARFVKDWHGPDPGFYGVRDVAVGPDDSLYILDQGRARVVKLAPDGTVITFGSLGTGPAQLGDAWGVAVGGGLVFVADTGNGRIQVWDTAGRFIRSQPVPQWNGPFVYGDVLVSADGRLLYASSPQTREVLVFAIDGTPKDSLQPTPPDQLAAPAALALTRDGSILVIDFDAARVSLLKPAAP